jgi:hypothetical protein
MPLFYTGIGWNAKITTGEVEEQYIFGGQMFPHGRGVSGRPT